MLIANLNGLKVKWTECKIDTSTRKGTFTLSLSGIILPLKIDKFTNNYTPSLLSLTNLITHVFWTAWRYKNSQQHSETWKLTEKNFSTFSEGKFPLRIFGVNWIKNLCNLMNSNWKWWWLQSMTSLYIHTFRRSMSVALKLIQIILSRRCEKTVKSYKTDFWS